MTEVETKGAMDPSDLLELCNTFYHIKPKRKSGFIHVVERSTGKVVKKTKTGRGAAMFIIKQLRSRQQQWEVENSKNVDAEL